MHEAPVTRFGSYELFPSSRELFKFGRKVKLRPQPFQVLSVLLNHAGDVVTREQLHQQLWPSDTFVDFEHGLNTSIKELRAALDDSATEPRYIETLPKLGYRFICPIEPAKPAASQAVSPQPATVEEPPAFTPAPVPPTSTSRDRRWTLAFFAVVAALLLGIVLLFGRLGTFRRSAGGATSASIKPRPSVAVLGFKNLSGRADADWMSTAMSEILGAELASGQQIRVIPSENVSRTKLDLHLSPSDTFAQDTLDKIHNNLGTDMIASGSFLALPSGSTTKLRIILQVQDTHTGETIATFTKDGTETDLPELISAGGDSLRHTLGLGPLSASAAREVRASVPSTSEAERLYAEGLAKLHAYDALAARALLEKAIAVDPNHALSHSALAEALARLGYGLQAQSEAKKALDLSANLSREDRLSIEGRYRALTHDRAGAVEIYRTLYNFFPDNLDYALRFAAAQNDAGHPNDALQTVTAMRSLPAPQGNDPRVDIAEAVAAEHLGDMKRSQKAAGAAVARAEALGSALMEASALHRDAFAWSNLGDLDKAIADETRGRSLSSAVGNTYDAAKSTHGIAIYQKNKGDLVEARQNFESALTEFRGLGAQWDIASCSHNLGLNFVEQGDLEQARVHLEEALRIHRELNDTRGVAFNLDDLGNVELSVGRLALAKKMKEEALQNFHEIGDKRGEATTMANLAEVLYQRGELAGAKEKYQQAMVINKEISRKPGLAYDLVGLAKVQTAEDQLSDALASAQESATLREQVKEEVHSAESDVQLALVAVERGKPAEAEPLARKAGTIFEKHKAPSSASIAYSVLTRSLVAQGKLAGAAAAERAASLARQGADHMIRMQADLATAELEIAAGNYADAQRRLELIRQQAHHDGYVVYELQARLLLAKAQVQSGNTPHARANIDQLESDARSRGFLLVARQAAAILQR